MLEKWEKLQLMEPNHSPSIKPPLVQMGCPSSPKTSFHGPSQVLEWSPGMFIPPQDHWAGPSLSLLWVPTCWRCLAGLARTLTPAPGDGRGGPVGAGARRRFPGKLLCGRKLHEGLFPADPADAPSPLQPQLELQGSRDRLMGTDHLLLGPAFPKGCGSFLICPPPALALSLPMVLVLLLELDSHLAWCCPVPAGIHTWPCQGAGSGDARGATGGSLGLVWDLG